MKLRRVLIISGAGLALLLLLGIAAAFTPAVQTWVVQRALATDPTAGISVGRISVGLHRVKLENVRFSQPGAVLTLPAAEIDLSVLSALLGRRLVLHRLVAQGWILDLTRPPTTALDAGGGRPETRDRTLTADGINYLDALRPPVSTSRNSPGVARGFSLIPAAYGDVPAAPVATGFTGIFNGLTLPVDLALDAVDLAGEILLPAVSGRPAARAKVTVTGGGLSAGRPGQFDYAAVVAFEGADAAVRQLVVKGTLGAVMDTPRSIARLVATTEAEATGPKFPSGVKLELELSAARSSYGETYAVSVSSGAKQLAAIETTYPAGATRLSGSWRLDMHDTDLAPFSLGRDLPVFEAVGEGRFDTDTAFAELRASGRLAMTADRLQIVDPQLAALGAIRLKAEFDFAQHGDDTRVDQLALKIEGAKPVATVQALQAFEFNFMTGELKVADPTKELLGVAFEGLPLAWLGPLLAREGWVVSGGDLQGEFAASARNSGFALRPKAPLVINGLAAKRVAGPALLEGLDVSLTVSADYAPQGWQVEVAPFVARDRTGPLLTVQGKVGQLAGDHQPVKVTGKWSGQLPGLLAQPIASGAVTLSTGEAQGEFVASLGRVHEIECKLALANLAAPGASALPSLAIDVRANREADGKITFNAPIRLERAGRASDLALAGTLTPTGGTTTVDARLTSDFLAIEDAQILLVPFNAAPPSAVAVASAAPSAPAVSPWAGFNGQVGLSLKKVSYNGQFQITDLTGQIRIDAGALKLVDGRGGFDADSDVKMSGGITFAPAPSPAPYTLAADFALDNFATAPAFRAIDPTRPPTIEARINLTSKLAASAGRLTELADRAHGELAISSKGGIFRGLSADLTDRIQKTQSRVAAIASFLGVVPDDYVNKTRILSEIAKALAEIPFDQLSVKATRDATSLNLELKDFSLISPEVRIDGTGEVKYVEGQPVLAQPLELQLHLGARGKLADLIKRSGLIESREDNLGYAAFSVPLRIRGTLGNPDTNDIRNALLNSALERSGLLDSLLGK